MAKKRNEANEQMDEVIVLTDQEGREHPFHMLGIFEAGKKNFALLHPVDAPENEVTFLKVTFAKDGSFKNFEDPTPKEFAIAQEAVESVGCGCGDEAECCGGEGGCCGGEEEAPAKKARKPAAKKAPAKKAAAKKAAAKKPAKKPAAKKATRKPAARAARRA